MRWLKEPSYGACRLIRFAKRTVSEASASVMLSFAVVALGWDWIVISTRAPPFLHIAYISLPVPIPLFYEVIRLIRKPRSLFKRLGFLVNPAEIIARYEPRLPLNVSKPNYILQTPSVQLPSPLDRAFSPSSWNFFSSSQIEFKAFKKTSSD